LSFKNKEQVGLAVSSLIAEASITSELAFFFGKSATNTDKEKCLMKSREEIVKKHRATS